MDLNTTHGANRGLSAVNWRIVWMFKRNLSPLWWNVPGTQTVWIFFCNATHLYMKYGWFIKNRNVGLFINWPRSCRELGMAMRLRLDAVHADDVHCGYADDAHCEYKQMMRIGRYRHMANPKGNTLIYPIWLLPNEIKSANACYSEQHIFHFITF